MIQLNLLPDVKKEFLRAERTRNVVIGFSILVTLIAAGVTVALALLVYVGQGVTSSLLSDDIKRKYSELQSVPDIDKYLTIQNQAQNLDDLHAQKYLYARAFGYLGQLNPSDPNGVALSSATFSKEDNTLQLEGSTANYAALTVFKTTLENAKLNYKLDGEDQKINMFETVALTEASVVEMQDRGSRATFKITAVYSKDIFDRAVKNATVEVPTLVTSDADRNTPQQPFTEGEGGSN